MQSVEDKDNWLEGLSEAQRQMHMDEGLQRAKRQYRERESFNGRTSNLKPR